MTWWIAIFAAALPSLGAMIVAYVKWYRNKPLVEAQAAEMLTNTATGLLDRMQVRIDHLEEENHRLETRVVELEARLDEAKQYFEEMGRVRHESALLRSENERLWQRLNEVTGGMAGLGAGTSDTETGDETD